jgi:uncharacterized protein DUF1559
LIWWFVATVRDEVAQAQQGMAAAQAAMAASEEAEESADNLEMIGRAIRAYEAAHGNLPNNTYDKQGKPLLSWRVHVLPYMSQAELYRKFHQDEPWDSPRNRPLVQEMPAEFDVIAMPNAQGGMTCYRGFGHKGAVFERPAPGHPLPRITLADGIPDGLADTILVIESGQAVEWTKPDDLDWSPGKPRPNLGGVNPRREYVLAVMADGRTRKIRRDVKDQTLRLLIGRQDGQAVPAGWEYLGP